LDNLGLLPESVPCACFVCISAYPLMFLCGVRSAHFVVYMSVPFMGMVARSSRVLWILSECSLCAFRVHLSVSIDVFVCRS
jgi:hypothetical protein